MKSRATWFDLDDPRAERPDAAILGLPWDASVSRRAGAAKAPARLRELSLTADPLTRRGTALDGVCVRDFGDVDPAPAEGPAAYFARARAALDALPPGAFVLALGGDNSVSIPALESFAQRHGTGAGVVWFDAHPDLFATYDGSPDSHACALRTGLSRGGLGPERAVLVATRSFAREETSFIRDAGVELVTAADWLALGPTATAERAAERLAGVPAVYLAVDIDGFDASCAPGTGYPLPGGVSAESFFVFLERLFSRLPVRAMDLTEIAPPLDVNDVTGFLGAQLVLETLGLLAPAAPSAHPPR